MNCMQMDKNGTTGGAPRPQCIACQFGLSQLTSRSFSMRIAPRRSVAFADACEKRLGGIGQLFLIGGPLAYRIGSLPIVLHQKVRRHGQPAGGSADHMAEIAKAVVRSASGSSGRLRAIIGYLVARTNLHCKPLRLALANAAKRTVFDTCHNGRGLSNHPGR